MAAAVSDPHWDPAIKATLDELVERAPALGAAVEAAIRDRFSSYGDVSSQSLQASCTANVRLMVQVLLERRRATPGEVDARASIGVDRALKGVAAEDLLSAWSLTMGMIRDEFLSLALARQADATTVLEATRLLWEMVEDVTIQLAVVHHDTEIALARQDEGQRAEFLRQLLFGSLGAGELNRRAATYGLDLSVRYHAVRARLLTGGDVSELRRSVETVARSTGGGWLVGLLDGDVAGVLAAPPKVECPDAVVGVGPAAHLSAFEPSFAGASRVVDVAVRFGLSGTLGLVDVAVYAPVAHESEIGDLLVERYLEPLSATPEFRRVVEETLRAYFAHGFALKRTAQSLGIHPNTLRYRLRRFEELTGAQLVDTEVLFSVWWALERARSGRS